MSSEKFKVGDKVRVHDITDGRRVYNGEVFTIKSLNPNDGFNSNPHYGVKEDCPYIFYENELEPICKFKVGDYVVCNTDIFCTICKGWVGKVVKILPDNEVKVEGLYGTVQCDTKYFDLYTKDQPTKIVITTDGKTTTAKMYRDKSVVKVETTKCHPDDRFDFTVGARIAFDRLVGKKKEEPETPTYYNGKVVCVDTCDYIDYTKGKIYQVIDGVITTDNGKKYPGLRKPFKSFEDLQFYSFATWLEVVE